MAGDTGQVAQDLTQYGPLAMKIALAVGIGGLGVLAWRRLEVETLKLLGVIAVFLGSLYVLTPSALIILDGPPPEAAQKVETKEEKRKPPQMEYLFDATDPKLASAVATELQQRLADAKIPTDRVNVDEAGRVRVVLAPGGRKEALLGTINGPVPLVTSLTPYDPKKAVAAQDEGPGEQRVSSVPDWVWSLLPPNVISLGLDLQGGVDMTLTVELEEAVLGQVNRDASLLADAAQKDGLAVKSAYRDTVDPVMHVVGDVPLADLQSWITKRFGPNYEYDSTTNTDAGADHAFRLSEAEIRAVGDSATGQVLETLRKRIDATGVKEPVIVKKGVGRIGVQLPGKVDLQAAIDAIGTTAVLEFHLVDESYDQNKLDTMIERARQALPKDQMEDPLTLLRWLHETGGLEADRIVFLYKDKGSNGEMFETYVALKSEVILTGADIAQASVGLDANEPAYVTMEFKSRGASVFCTVTGENVKKRFAIVLDNEIKSAPNINERICGGAARITMSGSEEPIAEANTLALVLRSGSLTAPVSIGQVTTVGASLGRDAIIDGTLSMVIGSFLVFIYMAFWYRVTGIVANVTLVLNVFLVLAFLAMFGATLTLPGICGIALTVGIAVDSNIIVFERIREELRLGVNARKAVDAGFVHAYSAIIDAHVTQAIAGVVLYSYGTGPIKGFAVAMIIGIATTLFTSLVASRVLMEVLTRNSASRLSI